MGHRPLIALALCGLLAAGVAAPTRAQSPKPTSPPATVAETPASELARRFLDAAKAGDGPFLAFIHESDPKTRQTDAQWRESRPDFAGLKPHSVAAATPTHAEFWVYVEDLQTWGLFSLDVTADAPHTITGIRVQPSGRRPPDVAAPPRLQPAALVAAVREHAAADAASDRFSGAVLIAEAGKPILTAAFGLADRETKTPNTVDTQFRFGSMGKMFTAVSIMQLAQAGKLDLTAPVGRYLPGYPNREIAEKVTVNNLLSHTGGTGDIFGPQFDAHRLELKEPKDYVALYGARAPTFPPGTDVAYSNYGFMLLGRIVETVSGQSYDVYIAQHIFRPAGMTATGNRPETVHLPKRAVGYTNDKGKLISAKDTLPWRGTPAGGGYSTVGDLNRFANALMANRLLDAAHTRLLTEGGFTTADGKFRRYDFGAPAGDGRHFYGHNGGAPGMNGELRIFPAEPPKEGEKGHPAFNVVVLANRDPPVADALAGFISDRLP